MRKSRFQPPAPEDLPDLYADLLQRLERLEGNVQQLRAQGNAAIIGRPTWRDVQPMQEDIRRLKEQMGLNED